MARFGVYGLSLLLLSFVQGARAQTDLVWKWKEGQKFYVETVTQVKQTLLLQDPRGDALRSSRGASYVGLLATPMGQASFCTVPALVPRVSQNEREVEQQYDHIVVLSYTVKKVNQDRSAELVQKIEKSVVRSADQVEKPDPLGAGAELVLHVGPKGDVTKVEGHEELWKRLSAGDSGKREAMAEALTEESLKKSVGQSLGFLPRSAVKVDGTWEQKADLSLGALGRLTVARDYVLRDEKNQVAQVAFTMKFKSFEPAKAPALAFQVTEGAFTLAEGTGSLKFDVAAGRLIDAETTVKLAGLLTIKNADTVYRANLTQEQTCKARVLDQLPAK